MSSLQATWWIIPYPRVVGSHYLFNIYLLLQSKMMSYIVRAGYESEHCITGALWDWRKNYLWFTGCNIVEIEQLCHFLWDIPHIIDALELFQPTSTAFQQNILYDGIFFFFLCCFPPHLLFTFSSPIAHFLCSSFFFFLSPMLPSFLPSCSLSFLFTIVSFSLFSLNSILPCLFFPPSLLATFLPQLLPFFIQPARQK